MYEQRRMSDLQTILHRKRKMRLDMDLLGDGDSLLRDLIYFPSFEPRGQGLSVLPADQQECG